MLKTKEEIIDWLEKYKIRNYTINDDLTVDVNGDVFLDSKGLISIDVQFNRVTKYFSCYNNELKSLKGCPIEVGESFDCSYNKLTSLKYCPERISGEFIFSHNLIKNLEYIPQEVSGYIVGTHNPKILEDINMIAYQNFMYLHHLDMIKIIQLNKDKLTEVLNKNENFKNDLKNFKL